MEGGAGGWGRRWREEGGVGGWGRRWKGCDGAAPPAGDGVAMLDEAALVDGEGPEPVVLLGDPAHTRHTGELPTREYRRTNSS